MTERSWNLVLVGPGLSGQRSNLAWLSGVLKRALSCSSLAGFDATVLDFAPQEVDANTSLSGVVRAWHTSRSLYRPPHLEGALRAADAFLFVADSQEARLEANIEKLEYVGSALGGTPVDLARVPGVVQYTKRDTRTALGVELLRAQLNPMGWPDVEAVPPKGRGVLEAFTMAVAALASVERPNPALQPPPPSRRG